MKFPDQHADLDALLYKSFLTSRSLTGRDRDI